LYSGISVLSNGNGDGLNLKEEEEEEGYPPYWLY